MDGRVKPDLRVLPRGASSRTFLTTEQPAADRPGGGHGLAFATRVSHTSHSPVSAGPGWLQGPRPLRPQGGVHSQALSPPPSPAPPRPSPSGFMDSDGH